MNEYVTAVAKQAQEELAAERFRKAVEAKKQELRAHRSFWQRFLDALPFTITIQRKK